MKQRNDVPGEVLRKELDIELLRRGLVGPVSSLALMLILYGVFWAELREGPGLMIGAALTGFSLLRLYAVAGKNLVRGPFSIGVIGMSLAWGILAIWSISKYGVGNPASVTITILICGLSSGGVTSVSPRPRLLTGMLFCLLVVQAVVLGATSFEGRERFFSVVYAVYFGFLWKQGSAVYAITAENIASTLHQKGESNKLQQILDSVPGLVSYLDTELKYITVNRRLELLLGVSREEIRGRAVGFMAHENEFVEMVRTFLDSPEIERVEERELPAPRGGRRWYIVSLAKTGVSGRELVCVSFDIHERKQLELENLFHRGRVESSAKMAALGEMAGGIAHEINNPLTVIHGFASHLAALVTEGNVDPTVIGSKLGKIVHHADRIAKIVRGLGSFSRNTDQDPFVEASMDTILSDTLELCRDKFGRTHTDFRMKVVPEIKLQCRPTEISQVLLNLLNNAVDAVEKRDDRWIDLEIFATETHVRIILQDSGPGISPDIRKKIMEPFFTTKDVGKGTGLGLSISKGIVESHQGWLDVDSTRSNTCFIVEIPKRLTLGDAA